MLPQANGGVAVRLDTGSSGGWTKAVPAGGPPFFPPAARPSQQQAEQGGDRPPPILLVLENPDLPIAPLQGLLLEAVSPAAAGLGEGGSSLDVLRLCYPVLVEDFLNALGSGRLGDMVIRDQLAVSVHQER